MMNNKKKSLILALEQTKLMSKKYPDLPYWDMLILQIEYILRIVENQNESSNRLNEVNIGLITVRELESLDSQYANLMYKVSKIVDDLKWGRY